MHAGLYKSPPVRPNCGNPGAKLAAQLRPKRVPDDVETILRAFY
jgi:hypothetical protein